jgi:hypothetical protein
MTILDATKRMRKSNVNRRILFHLSNNLASMALSERKIEIRKKGRKLITYREVK